jgi:HSP20 family molecular chaperone IbpA
MRYPITPQIDWDQTDEDVKLNVWIPGVGVDDLRCTLKNSFISVEVEPYRLEVDLHGDIEIQKSTAEIRKQGMRFHLRKVCQPAQDPSLLLR